MEHSPQDLTAATFAIVKKGYDPAEVRTYLGSVAKTLENAQQQAAAMEARARAAVAKLQELSQAQPPPAPAADTETSGDAAAISRALVVAQRTADGLIAEARTEADTMVSAARAEASSIVADARREAEQAIEEGRAEGRRAQEGELARAEGEVQALLARRDFLLSDVDHLEEFTATQRQRLIDAADAIRATAEGVAEHRRPLLSAAADAPARGTAIDGSDEDGASSGSNASSDNDSSPAGDAPTDADAHRTSTLAALVDDPHDADDSDDDEPTPVGNPNLLDFDSGGEGR